MGGGSGRTDGFDKAAAVTRSLLGYGVLAGVLYLTVGLTLALTRDGFDLTRHPLSLLMLGDHGWMQRANLGVAGLMVIVAAVGFARALQGVAAARRAGLLLGVYGASLVCGAVFPPDPMDGFPPGAGSDEASVAGILHLASGAIGFVSLAVAALVIGGWFARRDRPRWAMASRVGAAVVLAGFVGGAALSTEPAGVALLWLAVVVGFAWLAAASVALYRIVPHPDADRRDATQV